jgi:tRNA threonylcarbamoyladenosine biosynthesis protein TsaB
MTNDPPMIAIALETTSRTGSVALLRDGVVVEQREYPHGLQHAGALVPLLESLLNAHSVSPASVGEVYLSVGPGSFTGIRVGVTFAKAFALATDAKVVAVPTCHVLVDNAPGEARNVIIVLDAKRGQIFTARFSREATDDSWTLAEPARLDTLTAMLERAPRPVHLLGEGIPYQRASIPVDPQIIVCDESTWTPHASTVARIGQVMARAGQFADVMTLEPVYLRMAEAEEKRLQQSSPPA